MFFNRPTMRNSAGEQTETYSNSIRVTFHGSWVQFCEGVFNSTLSDGTQISVGTVGFYSAYNQGNHTNQVLVGFMSGGSSIKKYSSVTIKFEGYPDVQMHYVENLKKEPYTGTYLQYKGTSAWIGSLDGFLGESLSDAATSEIYRFAITGTP